MRYALQDGEGFVTYFVVKPNHDPVTVISTYGGRIDDADAYTRVMPRTEARQKWLSMLDNDEATRIE
jgi:hypothetical protein